MYYTQEQIDRANQADIVSFLQSQGEQLTRAGQDEPMSRRANHSQSDRPIANPAECGTHDARPSFRLKRGLYYFLEAVRCLPVCE